MPKQMKPKSSELRWDSFCFFRAMTVAVGWLVVLGVCYEILPISMAQLIWCIHKLCVWMVRASTQVSVFSKGFALCKTTKSYPLFVFSWPIRVSLSLCQTRQQKSIKLSSVMGSVVTGQAQLTYIHPLTFSFLSLNWASLSTLFIFKFYMTQFQPWL